MFGLSGFGHRLQKLAIHRAGRYALPWLAVTMLLISVFFFVFGVVFVVNMVYRDADNPEVVGISYLAIGTTLSVNLLVGMYLFSPVLRLDAHISQVYAVPSIVRHIVGTVAYMCLLYIIYWAKYGWQWPTDVEQEVEDSFPLDPMPSDSDLESRNHDMRDLFLKRELWHLVSTAGVALSSYVLVRIVANMQMFFEEDTIEWYTSRREKYLERKPFAQRISSE